MKGVTKTLLSHSHQVAKSAKAQSILICADAFTDPEELIELTEGKGTEIKIVRAGGPWPKEEDGDLDIDLPSIGLTRMGQVKLAVLVSISRGVLKQNDTIVCVAGLTGSGILDTMVVLDLAKEFEMFNTNPATITEAVDEAVFERVLEIAGRLAREGREGRPVGTTFVLGDSDAVFARLKAELQ